MNSKLATQIESILRRSLGNMKVEVTGDLTAIASYLTARSAQLQSLVGDPDFDKAVAAESDAALLQLDISLVQSGDKFDAHLFDIITIILKIGAAAAVGAVG